MNGLFSLAILLLLSSTTSYVLAQNVTTFATVGSGPIGLAFDSSGNLFVANSGRFSISKITPGGIRNNSYITGLNPQFITFDSGSNMYVSDANIRSIRTYDSAGVLINATFDGSLGFTPTGIKFDALGTLYVRDSTTPHRNTIGACRLQSSRIFDLLRIRLQRLSSEKILQTSQFKNLIVLATHQTNDNNDNHDEKHESANHAANNCRIRSNRADIFRQRC